MRMGEESMGWKWVEEGGRREQGMEAGEESRGWKWEKRAWDGSG